MLKRSRVFIDTLSIIVILSLFLQTYGQNRFYFYVPNTVTLSQAKQYCREYYTDVATLRNQNDIAAVSAHYCVNIHCWIGLQRNMNDTSLWYWSDGDKADFTNWNSGEPDGLLKGENCVVMMNSVWYDTPCDGKWNFLCYEDEPILVQENKTWEEALDYCKNFYLDPFSRSNFFKRVYDLLHIRSTDLSATARTAVVNAQTHGVWIGLRFLAGNWLWVNGTLLSNQVPVCPAAGNNCATLAKTGDALQFISCSEKRMFFCSRN